MTPFSLYSRARTVIAQSIVISGESGAGKSETAKKVLQHLAFCASRSSSGEDSIEARVIASSPLLEAFGNAKTTMNNNSSRYVKFLMLQFDLSGQLSGAHIKTYLLEKTRVVTQGCAPPSISIRVVPTPTPRSPMGTATHANV
jgi:myosin heavy subunit